MDEHLRARVREARGGDRQAEAAALTMQLRTGALGRRDLELAAYLGHVPAQLVLGDSVLNGAVQPRRRAHEPELQDIKRRRAHEPELQDIKRWIIGLERWGVPILLRALVGLSELAFDRLRRRRRRVDLEQLATTLAKARAWCDRPSDDAADVIETALEPWSGRWLALRDELPSSEFESIRPWLDAVVEAPEVILMAIGRDGHRFRQGNRDPRTKMRIPIDLFTASEMGLAVRTALLPLALAGASTAWRTTYHPPVRHAPAVRPVASSIDPRASVADLELAAFLGDEAAARALGDSVFNAWPGEYGWQQGTLSAAEMEDSDLEAWFLSLELWGTPWLSRGLCALARLTLPWYEDARPGDDRLASLLDAMESWCGGDRASNDAVARARERLARAELEVAELPLGEARSLVMNAIGAGRQAAEEVVPEEAGPRTMRSPQERRPPRHAGWTIFTLRRRGIDVLGGVRAALLPLARSRLAPTS